MLYVQTKMINSQFLLQLVQKHHKNETKVCIFWGFLLPEPMFRLYCSTLVFKARRKYLQCLLQFHINFRSFSVKGAARGGAEGAQAPPLAIRILMVIS